MYYQHQHQQPPNYQFRSRALPRSADPSPQRTTTRIEGLRRLSHSHHQGNQEEILFMCQGGSHCSGPECQFTQSIRQWQSIVRLQQKDQDCTFQSEVVEKAPLSLAKLDEKRKSLSQMKQILSAKLESKQRNKQKKRNSNRRRIQSGGAIVSITAPSSQSPSPNPPPYPPPPLPPGFTHSRSTTPKPPTPPFPVSTTENTPTPSHRESHSATSTLSDKDIGEVIRSRHRRRASSTGKQELLDSIESQYLPKCPTLYRSSSLQKVNG